MTSTDGFVASSAMEWQVPQVTFESVKTCTGYRTALRARRLENPK